MNDLESRLAAIADDVRLPATADDVLARGSQIRHRRHRRMAVGGVVAASVAVAVGATFGLPTGGPGLPSAAAAAWGPQAVNLRGADLAAATKACSDSVGEDMPADLTPIAADERRGTVVLVYRWNDTQVDCRLHDRPHGFELDGYGALEVGEPADGVKIELTTLSYSVGPADAHAITGGELIARVADDVAAVYLDVDGRLYQAEVESGIAVLWLPRGMTNDQVDRTAVIRAFDGEGNELEASAMTDVAFAD